MLTIHQKIVYDIFATCDAASPLGVSLGLKETETVEVADEQLCKLGVPAVTVCESGPNKGAIVTDIRLCQAPNDANKCPAETDLEGVYVNDITTDCDLSSLVNFQLNV